jgi:alpha-mannosidase
MALKRAELSDELIVRLVELDGKPQPDVRISFAAPITGAREVNGQEQPVGPATVSGGALVTSFAAYQPRTFAMKLGAAPHAVAALRSTPVTLQYDIATATNDGTQTDAGFDGKGNALPAEMLPSQIAFDDVKFQLAQAKTGVPNAIEAHGQTIELPSGNYNRVYLLAASADGDQKAAFRLGSHSVDVNVQSWNGFVGQWDDRQWIGKEVQGPSRFGRPARTRYDAYAEMTGIKPGYIKRADIGWYCSHHHDKSGANIPYSYSYLFAYGLDLAAGAKTITLPQNPAIRILAISVAQDNPDVAPVQPLYDTLGRSEPSATVEP